MVVPLEMIATRSATISTSESRWLLTSTVRPSARMRSSMSRISRLPTGSTPSVGSSSTTRRGSLMSAVAIPIRCCMPFE